MTQTGRKLEIDPAVAEKLGIGGEALWTAAHGDGSDNRINGDVVLEASAYGADVGLLAAGAQWIRRLFRNRGKTRADLAAEKEAAGINKTCAALEQMLLDYLRDAQEGRVDAEALTELTDTLEEMQAYSRAGKLRVPGAKELTAIRESITAFTSALAEEAGVPVRTAEVPDADEFALIREQLLTQKELTGGAG